MPNPEEGITFGDFTAEEWEKYFENSSSQIGRFPAVEFLFDFECSDREEQDSALQAEETRASSAADDNSVAKNVTTGLEDSGVEIGQESEQESAPAKTGKSATVAGEKEQSAGPVIRSNNEHIVFGGQSIVVVPGSGGKESGTASFPAVTSSPDADSFPPLSSTVKEKRGEKVDTERSRKRRKRRRQRKRSGSVSSSSSECAEKDRSSPGSVGKSKSAGLLATSDKTKGNKDTAKVHEESKDSSSNLADHKNTLQRNSTSSCDGKTISDRKSSSSTDGTSNSPVHSDSEVKTSSSVPHLKGAVLRTADVKTSTAESRKSDGENQEVTAKKETPKALSWADLFKGSSSKKSPGIVVKIESPVVRTEVAFPALDFKKNDDHGGQTIVSVKEDKNARKFAEAIQKQELNCSHKPFIPRGLTNRGNWCYINATLQALAGCTPFFNLFRKLPFIQGKGETSTPILDSLINFVNEFKELPGKSVNSSSSSSSKADFKIGEPFEPLCVYRMLSMIESSLSAKGRQEDAQEFLSCILNGMHEEMLQLSQLVSVPDKASEKENEELINKENTIHEVDSYNAQEDEGDWEQVGPKNKSTVTRMASYPSSLISDIFGGFLRSSVHQTGLKDSANVEPFFELQLDVQPVTSVEEALKNLAIKEEVQGYTCTKTKVQVDISRRVTLERLPKVLILHLKRFIYSKGGSQKLQKVIDYPLELSIGKELLSSNVKNKYSAAQKTYKLFAVVYHHGKNAWGGHYTSDVCHPIHGWIRADDTRLKIVPANYVLKPTQGKDPYVLFYHRTDFMP